MAKVKIKDLEVGMYVAADVCDLNGRFLINAGCELTDKNIKALNAWGVISIDINESDVDLAPQDTLISKDKLDLQINELSNEFIHNNLEHPFIRELITEAAKYLINKKLDISENDS